MGKLEGQVAFITGAARGQGRSHAVRLAREGADIIAVDICSQISSVSYPMSTPADLAQTVKEVEAEGRRIVARQADVRDVEGLRSALEEGIAALGVPQIVLANAGIGVGGPNSSDQDRHDVIAVNLTGVRNTGRIAIPAMIEADRGGSIVITRSTPWPSNVRPLTSLAFSGFSSNTPGHVTTRTGPCSVRRGRPRALRRTRPCRRSRRPRPRALARRRRPR